MKQLANIKKVTVNSDNKVTITLEFMALDNSSKKNITELIGYQGSAVEFDVALVKLKEIKNE